MKRRIALLPSIGLVLTVLQSVKADPVLAPPFPNDRLVAAVVDRGASFDPATGAFSITAPIVAVQLPNQVLTTEDPLIASGGVLRFQASFTGKNLSDTSGVFTGVTDEFLLGNQPFFREVSDGDWIYIGSSSIGNWRTMSWSGAVTTTLLNNPSLNSPFLNWWLVHKQPKNPTNAADPVPPPTPPPSPGPDMSIITISMLVNNSTGQVISTNIKVASVLPETSSILMVGGGLLLLFFGLHLSKKKRASADRSI